MEARNAGVTADPLFVGVTRPPMRFGVTYAALLLNAAFTMEVFLNFQLPVDVVVWHMQH